MINLNVHSSGDLLHSPLSVGDLVKEGKDGGSVCISNPTLIDSVKLEEECKKANVKPIHALNVGDYILVAKNLVGWKSLIKTQNSIQKGEKKIYKEGVIGITLNNSCELSQDWEELYMGTPRDFSNRELKILPNVAMPETYYLQGDAPYQRILLHSHLKSTYKKEKDKGDLERFFKSNSYFLSFNHEGYTKEEIENTQKIADSCENYSIVNKPVLPKCSENSVKELREICRGGWTEKIAPYIDKSKIQEYVDRVEYELKVIEDCGLSDYFLIVRDFIKFAHKNNIITGPGRGSAGGCLVSYLSDITTIDPIRFGLIFERFFNPGRKGQLPDIDIDFPTSSREIIIKYIREKYGHENVAQICTLGRLMGRGALREVLRINDFSFEDINKITESIPDEAKIADDLQEMEEEGEEKSIIKWSLINNPEKFKDYCIIENDELKGPLAKIFKEAIYLEGTPKSTGKHASGLVISPVNLSENIPMLMDKSGNEMMIGLELKSAEKYGSVKFDILGVSILDKMILCEELING